LLVSQSNLNKLVKTKNNNENSVKQLVLPV